MRMDFSVAWGRALASYEIADHAAAAEQAGFDMLGIIDTQNLARDPYPAMTIAALNTNRVRIGPSVTNTFTRHPAVTANAMATIDEISGGRAWVGLGSGFSAARTMDINVRPMALLENVINFIHTYTSGHEAEFNGAKDAQRVDTASTPGVRSRRRPQDLRDRRSAGRRRAPLFQGQPHRRQMVPGPGPPGRRKGGSGPQRHRHPRLPPPLR